MNIAEKIKSILDGEGEKSYANEEEDYINYFSPEKGKLIETEFKNNPIIVKVTFYNGLNQGFWTHCSVRFPKEVIKWVKKDFVRHTELKF